MSERYPRIRLSTHGEGVDIAVLRESISINFYLRRPHPEVMHAVMRSLDAYLRAVGPRMLGWYPDEESDWRELDDKGWEHIRETVRESRGANIDLLQEPSTGMGYRFLYRGWPLDDPSFVSHHPDATCTLSCWLPTEYLEAQGPARVRELALELAEGLPFDSGHAGLSFQVPGWTQGNTPVVRDLWCRHPGLDVPGVDILSWELGRRVRGVSWLTFLGQPVLGELGGTAGLRARLRASGITVEEIGGERAVVTLGEWPEAGDLEQGRTLPQYRELARILEPWLYAHRGPWGHFREEELRRWERRFL